MRVHRPYGKMSVYLDGIKQDSEKIVMADDESGVIDFITSYPATDSDYIRNGLVQIIPETWDPEPLAAEFRRIFKQRRGYETDLLNERDATALAIRALQLGAQIIRLHAPTTEPAIMTPFTDYQKESVHDEDHGTGRDAKDYYSKEELG